MTAPTISATPKKALDQRATSRHDNPIRGPESFLFVGSALVGGVSFSVYLFVAVIVLATFVQYGRTFGLSVLAVGDNDRAARLSGLHSNRAKFLAM